MVNQLPNSGSRAPYQPDLQELLTMGEAGYLTGRQHPSSELFIWNYTPRAAYTFKPSEWPPCLLATRGLITNRQGEVQSRPFTKFFNLEQHVGPLPDEPFEVWSKLDGSLGILYWTDDEEVAIATRGSFTSPQAVHATQLLNERYYHIIPRLNREWTYLFEIVYPKNRIVLDYGETDDIFLLAVIDTESGLDVPIPYDYQFGHGLWPPVAERYYVHDLSQLRSSFNQENREGFVIRYESGLRLKVKFAEYLRLHKLICGVTPRRVWELMSQSADLDQILYRVPDEFSAWVSQIAGQITRQYNQIESECQADFERALDKTTRAEAAAYFKTRAYPAVLFKMLDGQPYDSIIWKLVKPKAQGVFKESED